MGKAVAELIEMTPTRHAVRYAAPGAESVEVWAECNAGVVQDLTPWVALLGPVAARQGHDLHLVGAPVDEVALRNAGMASTLLHEWFPRRLSAAAVTAAQAVKHTPAEDGGVGCFFSGGVDSFYSVLTERERLTHLVFVHGFDIKIDDEDLAGRVRTELRAAADELGLPLLEVRTNVRSLADPVGLLWDLHYHGAALGGVAQLVAPHMGRILVPSTFATTDLHPFGSHPDLDPLWSSTAVAVEHDAPDASRPAKVLALIDDETAMARLRVCWRNPDGAYNCGRCMKCVTCRVLLALAGGDGRCATLPPTITPAEVRRMEHDRSNRIHLRGALRETADGSRPDLEAAVRRVVRFGPTQQLAQRVSRRLLRPSAWSRRRA